MFMQIRWLRVKFYVVALIKGSHFLNSLEIELSFIHNPTFTVFSYFLTFSLSFKYLFPCYHNSGWGL